MLYLACMFDQWTKEFYPVGVFDDKKKIEKALEGYKYSIVEYKINKVDYNVVNQITGN